MSLTEDPSILDVVQALESGGLTYPRDAIDAALANPSRITPQLLAILDKVLADPTPYTDPNRMGHVYAIMLLSHFLSLIHI